MQSHSFVRPLVVAAMLVGCGVAQATLVTNGSFENTNSTFIDNAQQMTTQWRCLWVRPALPAGL